MTKKSQQELDEARRRRKAAKEEQERQAEIELEKGILSFSEKRYDYLERPRKYSVIVSDLQGWYEELDKLTKKSPADQITNLQLKTVNDLIDEVKRLVTDDEFITKVEIFVAAGDNPEYRDVIGVLRRLRQGLDRFEGALNRERSNLSQYASEFFEEDIDHLLQLDLKAKYKREEFIDSGLYDRLK